MGCFLFTGGSFGISRQSALPLNRASALAQIGAKCGVGACSCAHHSASPDGTVNAMARLGQIYLRYIIVTYIMVT